MSKLMILLSRVDSLDGVIKTELRDSSFDHTIATWVRNEGDEPLKELDELCKEWDMPYAVIKTGGQEIDVHIGRAPSEEEDGWAGES